MFDTFDFESIKSIDTNGDSMHKLKIEKKM